jgi:hypothetical protein
MKTSSILLAVAFLVAVLYFGCGCTSITTVQTETATNGTIKVTRTGIRSFFDSSAKVKNLRTTFTDKSQGIGIGEAATESSGTNVVQVMVNGAKIAERVMIP